MHPVLVEIIACKEVPRLDVLRRWQQSLRDQVAPLTDEGEAARAVADAKRASKETRA